MNFGELSVLPWTSSSVYCQFNRSRTSSTESPVNNIYWIVNSIVNEPYWIVSSALKELHWFVSQMVLLLLLSVYSYSSTGWSLAEWARLNCQFSPERAPLICESNGSWMSSTELPVQPWKSSLICESNGSRKSPTEFPVQSWKSSLICESNGSWMSSTELSVQSWKSSLICESNGSRKSPTELSVQPWKSSTDLWVKWLVNDVNTIVRERTLLHCRFSHSWMSFPKLLF